MTQERTPSPEIVAQARTQPNSWIYVLEGKFGSSTTVPREAVVGAWQVDSNGNITGSFIRNPNHHRAPKKTATADPPLQFPWQTGESSRRA